MNYAAAIFDIVDSRKIKTRYQAQYFIKKCLNSLNIEFSSFLKKPVIFGAGDEFQGLFFKAEDAFAYARRLQLLIYPIKIRCGIGYGTVKYDQKDWQSTEIDGEAFYKARDAIKSIPGKGSGTIFFNVHDRFNQYINMYSIANTDIKNRQSQMVRLIELIIDILNPLFSTNKDINIFDESFLKELFENKKEILIDNLNKNLSNEKSSRNQYINLDINKLYANLEKYDENKNSNIIDNSNKYYIDCYWNRGMSVVISEIVQTSRQNIDKHINIGKIKESRNMDGTILMMLGEVRNYG